MFAAVLVFYLGTRLYGIEDFPIYFFCDEATQANLAEQLVENGFRDDKDRLFPAFFLNAVKYNLGLTVWIYALPVAVFGKSVLVVRATSVFVGALGVASLMMALKWFYAARLWWAGGLVIATLPAWFIHSRTGFETVFMVSFYAAFVLAYLLYREVSARWLIVAVFFGAATFYSYSNGQGVMVASTVLLVFTDWRHHRHVIQMQREPPAKLTVKGGAGPATPGECRLWVGAAPVPPGLNQARICGFWRRISNFARSSRDTVAAAALAAVLLSAPYLQFRFVHEPEMLSTQLVDLKSYWVHDRPLPEKLAVFGRTYLRGVSPGYWFSSDNDELIRHRLPGEPNLPVWLAPPILLGFAVCLRRVRSSAPCRMVLIALLAAPFSASLVELQITRVLAGIVPATLFAVIGLESLRSWTGRWISGSVFASVVGISLVASASVMTARVVAAGGTPYSNFGLYGMQWGARQVFDQIRESMASDPDAVYAISSGWANNPRSFGEFFLTPAERERIWWFTPRDLVTMELDEVNPSTVFVMSSEDYRAVLERPELEVGGPLAILHYPNGEPGFHFLHIAYSEQARKLIEARRYPRRSLVEDEVTTLGERWKILRPELDDGVIGNAFDGDLMTYVRTRDAQMAIVVIKFPSPRSVDGVRLHLWYDDYDLGLRVVRTSGEVVETGAKWSSPVELTATELRFPETVPDVAFVEITVTKKHDAHVHVREIEMLPATTPPPSGRRTELC